MTECSHAGCSATLSKRNKSGFCRSHSIVAVRARPGYRERNDAGLRVALADPEKAAVMRAARERAAYDPAVQAARAAGRARRMAADPELRERIAAKARANLRAWHTSPACNAEWLAQASEKKSRKALSWCPLHRMDEYKALRRRGLPAADAKRAILDDEAAIERRRLAAMTPHERDLERIRKGAGITTKQAIPSREHGFSLIGGSLE